MGFSLPLSYVKYFVVGYFSAISDHEELHQRGQRPHIKSILSILGHLRIIKAAKLWCFHPPGPAQRAQLSGGGRVTTSWHAEPGCHQRHSEL